jgi:hypothetical protein
VIASWNSSNAERKLVVVVAVFVVVGAVAIEVVYQEGPSKLEQERIVRNDHTRIHDLSSSSRTKCRLVSLSL